MQLMYIYNNNLLMQHHTSCEEMNTVIGSQVNKATTNSNHFIASLLVVVHLIWLPNTTLHFVM